MRSIVLSCMLLVAVSLCFGNVSAQEYSYVAPHANPPVQKVDLNNPGKFAKIPGPPHDTYNNGARGSITWSVTYTDVDSAVGHGFDDPTDGADRRATVVAVLAYVDTVLGSTTPATIDVDFGLSETNGPADNLTLASAGTFFPSGAGAFGFFEGVMAEHVRTGVDPAGAGLIPDITSTVDFGFVWNSDHTVLPGIGETDLFTVILHEITHGLGFSSHLNIAGVSRLNLTNPGAFSVLDSFVELDDSGTVGVGSSTDLFDDGTFTFVGTVPGDLTGGRVVSVAPTAAAVLGSNPLMNSGAVFAGLSHWDLAAHPTAVMKPSIGSGVIFREYLPFEIGMLIDMGYANAAGPPTTPTFNFTSTSYGVLEDAGSKLIGVTLSPASTLGSVSVTYSTSVGGGNPATPGVDYTAVSSTLTWLIGESGFKSFSVPIISNAPVESTETVALTLSSPTGDGVLGTTTTATLNIVDPLNMPINPYLLLGTLAGLGIIGFVIRRRFTRS